MKYPSNEFVFPISSSQVNLHFRFRVICYTLCISCDIFAYENYSYEDKIYLRENINSNLLENKKLLRTFLKFEIIVSSYYIRILCILFPLEYKMSLAIIRNSYAIRRQNFSWVELKKQVCYYTNETFRFGIVRLANFSDCDERRKGYLGHGCNRNETISPRVGRKIHGCHGTSGTHVQSSFQRHVATRGESCRNVENWPMTIIARNFRTAYGSTPPHFFPWNENPFTRD